MDQNQTSSLFSLNVDHISKSHLAETARWAKFLSIIGFIGCGLIVLIGLFFGSIFSMMMPGYRTYPYDDYSRSAVSGISATVAIFYILAAVINFFPVLFLYRFATKMKAALAANDQEALNTSFQNLKACLRFIGIITIILLAIWVLALVIGLLSAATVYN
jgi:hypothetical protein